MARRRKRTIAISRIICTRSCLALRPCISRTSGVARAPPCRVRRRGACLRNRVFCLERCCALTRNCSSNFRSPWTSWSVTESAKLRRPTVQGDRCHAADGAHSTLGSTDASVQARSRFTAAGSAACEFAQNLIERPKLHCAEPSFPITLDRPDRLALNACDFPTLRCE